MQLLVHEFGSNIVINIWHRLSGSSSNRKQITGTGASKAYREQAGVVYSYRNKGTVEYIQSVYCSVHSIFLSYKKTMWQVFQ